MKGFARLSEVQAKLMKSGAVTEEPQEVLFSTACTCRCAERALDPEALTLDTHVWRL